MAIQQEGNSSAPAQNSQISFQLPEQLIPPEHQDPENVQRAMVCWIIACVLFFVGLFGIVLWICLWPVAAVFAIFGLKYFYTPAEGTGNTSGGAENV